MKRRELMLGSLALAAVPAPDLACASDLDKDGARIKSTSQPVKMDAAVPQTAVPLRGKLPSEPESAALRLENVSFPAGTQKVQVFMRTTGLVGETVDSAGYVGAVSPAVGMGSQSFQLKLERVQVRALGASQGTPDKAFVVLQAFDRSGRVLPGLSVQRAMVVDGNSFK